MYLMVCIFASWVLPTVIAIEYKRFLGAFSLCVWQKLPNKLLKTYLVWTWRDYYSCLSLACCFLCLSRPQLIMTKWVLDRWMSQNSVATCFEYLSSIACVYFLQNEDTSPCPPSAFVGSESTIANENASHRSNSREIVVGFCYVYWNFKLLHKPTINYKVAHLVYRAAVKVLIATGSGVQLFSWALDVDVILCDMILEMGTFIIVAGQQAIEFTYFVHVLGRTLHAQFELSWIMIWLHSQ